MKSGRVPIRLPGQRTFGDLSTSTTVPLRSEVDATRGTVAVTVTPRTRESADVGAIPRDPGFRGRDSDLERIVREDAARAPGCDRTPLPDEGRFAAATGAAKGSIWTLSDRCGSTRTDVQRGSVDVTDFTTRKIVRVRAGNSYVAEP
jgi:hypothetical protein